MCGALGQSSAPAGEESVAPAPRRSLHSASIGGRPMSAPPAVRRFTLPPRLPAEEEMRLRQLFHEMDANGDGAIDEHELRHLLREMGRYRGERALSSLLSTADRKGRGLVELRELLHGLAAIHHGEALDLPCVVLAPSDAPAAGAKQHTAPMAALRETKVDRIMDAYAVQSLFDTFAVQPGSPDASAPASTSSQPRRFGSAMSASDDGARGAQSIPSGAIEMLLSDMFDIQLDGPLAPAPAANLNSNNREHNRNRELRLADIEDLLLTAH